MQIQIVSGIYSDENGDFRVAYPVNMVPFALQQGVSNGYLRPADGVLSWTTGQGADRGAIVWNDVCYRVSGTKLVRVSSSGTVTVLGDVGGTGQVKFDYSFDRLAVNSGGNYFYWDGSTLTQVTDPDLGTVIDHIWVDGYFMTTDGEFLVVTELLDPTSIDPLKYGSSEVDPDPINAIHKLRNEPNVVNRHTIEVFENVANTLFPFQRNAGAQVTKGSVGTHASCVFADAIAFVGGGRNEAIAVYLANNGQSVRISTAEIDKVLNALTSLQLSKIVCEVQVGDGQNILHIRLPDRTLSYDLNASQALGDQVWFISTGGTVGYTAPAIVNRVWCYGKWIVGHPTNSSIGQLTKTTSKQWGNSVQWQFTTPIVYNESKGALIHELELVALTGRVELGTDPQIWTDRSVDGETWSQPRYITSGKQGNRSRRLRWIGQGSVENMRMQRFTGTSDSHLTFARLEARVEPLAW